MIKEIIEAFYVRKEIDESAPEDGNLFYYEIRCDDKEGKEPYVVECMVLKDYFGTVGLKEPLHLDVNDSIVLSNEDREYLKQCKQKT